MKVNMTVEQAINHLKEKGMWLNPLAVAVGRALGDWGRYLDTRDRSKNDAVEKIRDKAGI